MTGRGGRAAVEEQALPSAASLAGATSLSRYVCTSNPQYRCVASEKDDAVRRRAAGSDRATGLTDTVATIAIAALTAGTGVFVAAEFSLTALDHRGGQHCSPDRHQRAHGVVSGVNLDATTAQTA